MINIDLIRMLDEGRIEEVKKILKDELYKVSLTSKSGAHRRYSAMKKYFKYHKFVQEYLSKPCKDIEFEGKKYNSFTNSWSLVLTSEDIGEIEPFNKETGKYPDVARLIYVDDNPTTIDISKVIAKAKTEGYKLVNKEVGPRSEYLVQFKDTYYKLGLLHSSYEIINDGKPIMIFIPDGPNKAMTIKTSIGYCVVMPVKYVKDPDDPKIIIKIDKEEL